VGFAEYAEGFGIRIGRGGVWRSFVRSGFIQLCSSFGGDFNVKTLRTQRHSAAEPQPKDSNHG